MIDTLDLQSYDYKLPKELIAKSPVDPKDSAKLLVYNRKDRSITHAIFRNIDSFLPKNLHMMFNDTKVIKARLFGKKQSGGAVEIFINRPLQANRFSVLIKGRVKVGTTIVLAKDIYAQVLSLLADGSREVLFFRNDEEIDFLELIEVLDKIGHVPLPPYIDREDNKSDEILYQSIFAKHSGAVAAPTASLHFTDELLKRLAQKKHYLTLHVGAGTFKGVEVENILEHTMHAEVFDIPKATQAVINSDADILAVGTTVTRTIEYFARTHQAKGECDLFLHPQNRPIRVNHLLTNFHLPKSTLIMLVASFVGLEETKRIYDEAIAKRYRFYSYGDAMLIL